MSEPLLQVSELTFLENGPYSFDVSPNEIVGLTGPSGIGKTQLLRALVETIEFHGKVFLESIPSADYLSPEWRRKVSLVPAESVWWYSTVAEHFSGMGTKAELPGILHNLGFGEEVLSWKISRLSTGERQRLALVRAILHQPMILLLDEPCSALDAESVDRVEQLVGRYIMGAKRAVIWVSHDFEQLQRVADSCYIVEKKSLQPKWLASSMKTLRRE